MLLNITIGISCSVLHTERRGCRAEVLRTRVCTYTRRVANRVRSWLIGRCGASTGQAASRDWPASRPIALQAVVVGDRVHRSWLLRRVGDKWTCLQHCTHWQYARTEGGRSDCEEEYLSASPGHIPRAPRLLRSLLHAAPALLAFLPALAVSKLARAVLVSSSHPSRCTPADMAAPGPWGEAPRPYYPPYARRPHSPPAPLHPYAAVSAPRYYGQPANPGTTPGFYNPALPRLAPATPPSGSPPAFPEPRVGLPASLVPGRQSNYTIPRSQSNDYFFQSDVKGFPGPPRHTQTAPVPPLPRKPDFDQPPLPPKPPSQPNLHGAPFYASPESSPAPSAPPFALSQQQDDAILNRVLAMSAQESRQTHGGPMLSEEEQLSRALEESLKLASSSPPVGSPDRRYSVMTSSPEQGPSAVTAPPVPDLDISARSSSRRSSNRVSGHTHVFHQISADEALARQLAEEEERLLQQEEEEHRRRESQPQSQSPASPNVAGAGTEADPLPHYDEAVSSPPPASSSAFYNSSLTAHFAPSAGPSQPASPSTPTLGRSVSERPSVSPKTSTPPDFSQPLGRTQSLGVSVPTTTTSLLTPTPQTPPLSSSASSPSQESIEHEGRNSTSPGVEVMTNTQYLDAELLGGLGECTQKLARRLSLSLFALQL